MAHNGQSFGRNQKRLCGIIWDFNTAMVPQKKVHGFVDHIRKSELIEKDFKEEFFICLTDVPITSDLILSTFYEKKVTVIHHSYDSHINTADFLWLFSYFDENHAHLVIISEKDHITKQNSVKHTTIKKPGDLNWDITLTPTYKTLAFANYPKSEKGQLQNLTDYVKSVKADVVEENSKPKGQVAFSMNFNTEKDCEDVQEQLESRVLVFIPKKNTEGDEDSKAKSNYANVSEDSTDKKSSEKHEINKTEFSKRVKSELTQECPEMLHADITGELRKTIVLLDYQNCGIGENKDFSSYADILRKMLITKGYKEEAFVCVSDFDDMDLRKIEKEFQNAKVTMVHVPKKIKPSADVRIKNYMNHFSSNRPGEACIILITSDADFIQPMKEIHSIHGNKVISIYHEMKASDVFKDIAYRFNMSSGTSLTHTSLLKETKDKIIENDGIQMDLDLKEKFKMNGTLLEPHDRALCWFLICKDINTAKRLHQEYRQKFHQCSILKVSATFIKDSQAKTSEVGNQGTGAKSKNTNCYRRKFIHPLCW